jgi:hypothetical protein
MDRKRKRYLEKWRADHKHEIAAYQKSYQKKYKAAKKKKVEVKPTMNEKKHDEHKGEEQQQQTATPAAGGVPPKPEKGDTRLYQLPAGRKWLTKAEATKQGLPWVDEPKE